MLDYQFYIHASKDLVIIMNLLRSIYNSPFKDSHSYPIHTWFPIIAGEMATLRFKFSKACSNVGGGGTRLGRPLRSATADYC